MREVLYEDQLLHKKINTTNKLAKQIFHTLQLKQFFRYRYKFFEKIF